MLIDGIFRLKWFSGSWEISYPSIILFTEFEEFFRVNPIFIINAPVELSHTNQFRAFFNEKFRRPVPYITETLNYKGFPFHANFNS